METSVLTEILPIDSLQIRPITVISDTLNAFRSVYNLDKSPLIHLVLNPLLGQLPSNFTGCNVIYKGFVSIIPKWRWETPNQRTGTFTHFRIISGQTGCRSVANTEDNIRSMHRSDRSQYISVGRCSWYGEIVYDRQLSASTCLRWRTAQTVKNFDLFEKQPEYRRNYEQIDLRTW